MLVSLTGSNVIKETNLWACIFKDLFLILILCLWSVCGYEHT